MRIAVNARFLRKNHAGGIGKFTHETFSRLTRTHPEVQFYFIFDRPFSNDFVYSPNVTPLVAGMAARHPLLWLAWYEWSIPRTLAGLKPSLFISPDGFLPLRTKVKSIAVIHDLNFEYYPHFVPFAERQYYRYYFPRFAKKANRIITVSEYSRKDISRTYKIPVEKIDVAYNGPSEECKPLSPEEQQMVRNQYSDGAEYFIFVGGLYPRKNIRNLLLAFDGFKRMTGSDFRMILTGPKIRWATDWEYVYERMAFKDQVRFVKTVDFQEVARLIGSSFALVFPSYFEGFGIPIVEAMSCDVPVITSKTSSMPEVAGNAAMLVDPFSIESITGAMVKIFEDKPLRQSLIDNGRLQCRKFSWDKTAEAVWNSIERTMNG